MNKKIISKKIKPVCQTKKHLSQNRQEKVKESKAKGSPVENLNFSKTEAICFGKMTYSDGRIEERTLGDK